MTRRVLDSRRPPLPESASPVRTRGSAAVSTCWQLGAIVAVYLSGALAASWLIPAWEANDEMAHTANIEYVARNLEPPPLEFWGREKFPDRPGYKQVRWFQSHQPPLYYWLAALWQYAVGVPPFSPFPLEFSPGMGQDPPHLLYLHDYNDRQRLHAEYLHRLRLLSILLGLGTVLTVHAVARRSLGRADLALASASFVAFLPKFLILSAVVTNDILVILLSSVALLLAIRYLQQRRIGSSGSWVLPILLGIVAGSAVLTKLNSLPLAAGFVVVPLLAAGPLTRRLRDAGSYLAGFLFVAGWWFVRNDRLYGDFLGQSAAIEWLKLSFNMTISVVPWTDTERFLQFVPKDLANTSWYVGGWNQFTLPLAWTVTLSAVAVTMLILGCYVFLRRRLSTGEILEPRVGAVLALTALAGLVAVLIIARSTPHAEGRIAYVGIAGFVPLVILGTTELGALLHLRRVALVAWPLLLVALDGYVFVQFIWPFRGL